MITFLDTLLQSTALKSNGPARIDYLFVKVRVMIRLMIDGDKKVVSKQPFASFLKVNSLQS